MIWWAKFGAEFFEDMQRAGVSDMAFRAHVEAIMWAYRNDGELVIPHRLLSRVTVSADPEAAAGELCSARLWKKSSAGWLIIHHADVIRDSIAAQDAKRRQDRNAQQARRKRVREAGTLHVVSADPYIHTDHTDLEHLLPAGSKTRTQDGEQE